METALEKKLSALCDVLVKLTTTNPAWSGFGDLCSTTDSGHPVTQKTLQVSHALAAEDARWQAFTAAFAVDHPLPLPGIAKSATPDLGHYRMCDAMGLLPYLRDPMQKNSSLAEMQKRFTNRGTQTLGEEMQLLFDKVKDRLTAEVRELIQKAIRASDYSLYVRLMSEALVD